MVKKDQQNFHLNVNRIINQTQTPYYPLDENYSQLEIWSDVHHVTTDEKGLIFSEDVAKIIIKELQ